jgi:hypothetical protein
MCQGEGVEVDFLGGMKKLKDLAEKGNDMAQTFITRAKTVVTPDEVKELGLA